MPKLTSPAQKLKMARWIEKGLKTPGVREVRSCFIDARGHCCVIGCALVGKFGSVSRAFREFSRSNHYEKLLGITAALFYRINSLHRDEGMTALEIAKRLRAEALDSKKKKTPFVSQLQFGL